jgi:hypothetical protein
MANLVNQLIALMWCFVKIVHVHVYGLNGRHGVTAVNLVAVDREFVHVNPLTMTIYYAKIIPNKLILAMKLNVHYLVRNVLAIKFFNTVIMLRAQTLVTVCKAVVCVKRLIIASLDAFVQAEWLKTNRENVSNLKNVNVITAQ